MPRIPEPQNGTRQQAILYQASALYRTRGYKATSMRELAAALHIQAPSLYNHFKSKEALLQAICFSIAGKFTAGISAAENATGNLKKIESVIQNHIRLMLEEPDAVYVANHEWRNLNEPVLSLFMKQRRNYEKRLLKIIETGIQKKEFKNTNAYISTLTVLSSVRVLELGQVQNKFTHKKDLEQTLLTILLHGLKK